jgi:hypothetical protein
MLCRNRSTFLNRPFGNALRYVRIVRHDTETSPELKRTRGPQPTVYACTYGTPSPIDPPPKGPRKTRNGAEVPRKKGPTSDKLRDCNNMKKAAVAVAFSHRSSPTPKVVTKNHG